MVCHRCQQTAELLLKKFLGPTDRVYLHEDVPSLLSSLDGGCPVCAQIYSILTADGCGLGRDGGLPESLPTTTTTKIRVRCDSTISTEQVEPLPIGLVCLRLKFSPELPSSQCNGDDLTGSGNSTTFTLSAAFSPEIPSRCFPPGAPDSTGSTDTASEEVASLLAWWVKQCSENHNCGRRGHANPTFVPPRLLKVDEDVCRLIETSTTAATGPYIALSYRWGVEPRHLVLATSNIARLMEGIEYGSLPKTFRDAVVIARRLQIRYLWVDSLCILQSGDGHAEDWANHVPHMGTIYENCFLNIAAADAPDADGGCFYPRAPGTLQRPTAQVSYKGKVQPFEFASRDIQGRVGLFPLNERAWVFQERLMSPRTVHFSRYQMYWECEGVAAASECFPRGIPDFYRGNYADSEARAPPYSLWCTPDPEGAATFMQPAGNPAALFHPWEDIVAGYNTTTMTRSEDKLAAIAGFAKRIAAETNDEYIAGIFRSQLPLGLCWATGKPLWDKTGSASGRRVGGPYRAPSWSWASTDGQLEFPASDDHQQQWQDALREEPTFFRLALRLAVWLVEVKAGVESSKKRAVLKEFFQRRSGSKAADILDLVIDPVTLGDSFGQIHSASLKLRGPLFRLGVRKSRLETGWKPSLEDRPFLLDMSVWWDQRGEMDTDYAHVLVLHYVETGFLQRAVYGLVLSAVDDVHAAGGAQHYRRIGMFCSTSVRGDWKDLMIFASEVVLV